MEVGSAVTTIGEIQTRISRTIAKNLGNFLREFHEWISHIYWEGPDVASRAGEALVHIFGTQGDKTQAIELASRR